ncbi:FAD-binding protein [Sandarakinorhabdus sp.]|uniref:FAD-binding protein n=1 Tax=Sandarakinorhabdus sp. TaxID=1916663 RepID=UPI00286E5ACC|nr:FAD-binding protein [Sandarakinorhabdus sp.]
MASDPLLTPRGAGTTTNFHGTVKGPAAERWYAANDAGGPKIAGLRKSAQRLRGLIADAVSQGMRLRVQGSRWSFSEICDPAGGWILQTDQLNWLFRVGPANLDPGFAGRADELILAQCGASIAEINAEIEPHGQALRTSGASNGQTIAGAIGTGIHGSAVDVGALQSQVAGLHLLTASRSLWLEHPSAPVMNADFAAKLGAELVRDALLFDAALVSLGALGIVHAVLLRTTGRYRLRSWLLPLPFAAIERAINTLDFTGVPLPRPHLRPYFFQAVIDPARPDTAHCTVRYKEPCPPDHVRDDALKSGYEAGNDLPGVIAKLLDVAPAMRQTVVSLLIKSELRPFAEKLGLPGETYSYTASRPGSAGSALAVPLAYTSRAIGLARQAFAANTGAPVILACRFVQRSPGLLAFTRFDPCCVLDVDGLDNKATRAVMEAVRATFDADGLPYAQHWGKLHGLTAARVRASYGSNLDRWTAARHALMPDKGERDVFSIPLFDHIGLNA